MTPFAHLGGTLEKSAGKGSLLVDLVRNGVWRTAARRSADGGLLNRTARLFHNPNLGKIGKDGIRTGKATGLYKGLAGYGWAGLGAGLMGHELPGSQLAFNTTMPGLGAMFSAPGLITAGRMRSAENQAKLKDDVYSGAQAAGGDLMSLVNSDRRFATKPGLYQDYMAQQGYGDLAAKYSAGQYKPLSAWQKAQSLFTDSQGLINDRVDKEIFGQLKKSSSLQKQAWGGAIGRGIGKVFPWLFPAMGAGLIGHSVMRDKPYDAQQARARGYAGAQSKMQQRISGMSPFERLAVTLDPSLVGSRIEEDMPGTIKQWENSRGTKHQPGWISNMADNWKRGGNHSYYEYDAAGQRHYT